MEIFSRTEMLFGPSGMDRLRGCEVMIFGLGGVGSYVAEALVRCGVGRFIVVDADTVCPTNINRQVIALQSTVGQPKADAVRGRMLAINPEVSVTAVREFVGPGNIADILPQAVSYVVDAVDTVTAKLAIAERCNLLGAPVISCMGTGNKLHPERLMLADIYETKICPLAKVMRRELRKRGVDRLAVCYSEEEPIKPLTTSGERCRTPGSVSFVPPVAGMIIAGKVVRDLLGIQ